MRTSRHGYSQSDLWFGVGSRMRLPHRLEWSIFRPTAPATSIQTIGSTVASLQLHPIRKFSQPRRLPAAPAWGRSDEATVARRTNPQLSTCSERCALVLAAALILRPLESGLYDRAIEETSSGSPFFDWRQFLPSPRLSESLRDSQETQQSCEVPPCNCGPAASHTIF